MSGSSNEARTKAILRALPDLMFVQSRDGTYVDYHAKDESVLLAPPSAFLGKRMRDILPPDLCARFEEKFEQVYAGEELVIMEYEVPLPNGEVGTFEARIVRCDSDKTLSIVRDITPQRRADAEILSMQAELFRVSKLASLGEFAGSMAHELAQPIVAIVANASAALRFLDRGPEHIDEVRHSLDDIVTAAKAASDVVSRNRRMFERSIPEQTLLDMSELVDEVSRMITPTLNERRVSLDLRVDTNGSRIRGDRTQLRQVMLNLVSNGIQAIEEMNGDSPRRLTIAAAKDGSGNVRMTVSDTGVGLETDDHHRLFTAPFSRQSDGLGWGLATSRSIVESHGGRMWAEPNEEGGASFSFTVPLATAQHSV